MNHQSPRFPDADGSLPDPELLLELAAWVDGTLPADRVTMLEGRLASDPQARALAASVRLEPVTPADAAAPVPADLVARAAALVATGSSAGAPATGDVPIVETTRGSMRFPLATALRTAGAIAACLGAAAIGWQLGGSAGRPTAPTTGSDPTVARGATVDAETGALPGELLAAASFGVFDGGDDADDDPLQFLALIDPTGSGLSLDGGTTR
jgi:anti-sigma factor RsiW